MIQKLMQSAVHTCQHTATADKWRMQQQAARKETMNSAPTAAMWPNFRADMTAPACRALDALATTAATPANAVPQHSAQAAARAPSAISTAGCLIGAAAAATLRLTAVTIGVCIGVLYASGMAVVRLFVPAKAADIALPPAKELTEQHDKKNASVDFADAATWRINAAAAAHIRSQCSPRKLTWRPLDAHEDLTPQTQRTLFQREKQQLPPALNMSWIQQDVQSKDAAADDLSTSQLFESPGFAAPAKSQAVMLWSKPLSATDFVRTPTSDQSVKNIMFRVNTKLLSAIEQAHKQRFLSEMHAVVLSRMASTVLQNRVLLPSATSATKNAHNLLRVPAAVADAIATSIDMRALALQQMDLSYPSRGWQSPPVAKARPAKLREPWLYRTATGATATVARLSEAGRDVARWGNLGLNFVDAMLFIAIPHPIDAPQWPKLSVKSGAEKPTRFPEIEIEMQTVSVLDLD